LCCQKKQFFHPAWVCSWRKGHSKYQIVEGETLRGNRQIILGRRIAEALNTSVGKTIDLAGKFDLSGRDFWSLVLAGKKWGEL
jgi:hypothetical protein